VFHRFRIEFKRMSKPASSTAPSDLQSSRSQLEARIALQPQSAQLHLQLGALQWRLGRVEAGACFVEAVELDPTFVIARAALSTWSLEQGLIETAEHHSIAAMRIAPEDNIVLQSRAAVLEALGEIDLAWDIVTKLVSRNFTPLPLVRLYGRMARYQRHQSQALELIHHLLARHRAPADRSLLHFTAAELLDSLGRYDEAFKHARLANDLVRPPYDPKAHERSFDMLIRYFTRDRLSSLARASVSNQVPVFIVGMPRSGTSLVEQILSTHSQLHGAGELDFLQQVWTGTMQMLNAAPNEYPSCLDRLTTAQAEGMSQIYLQPLLALDPAAKRITDKLPLNFLHLGLVQLLLPGARVIDCVRDVRDTCISCYMATFNGGNEFKHDLNHTAHFYEQSRRLMRHWRETLDLPILEVSYEQLVTNPEIHMKKMLAFLGLPWEAECLQFHRNKRAVVTSSMQQVRLPMYQSSVGRWRNYFPES
jgi:tetratricopeptide (TPR) repeat protein